MESCVCAVVVANIVGSSSSSPPPPNPTWGELEGRALPDRGGFKRWLRATGWGGGQLPPPCHHIPTPTSAAAGSVLSSCEFRAPCPHTEAYLAAYSVDRLVWKLQLEMASRLTSDACTAPLRWGPWLYYHCRDEGKQYPVLFRHSAALHRANLSGTVTLPWGLTSQLGSVSSRNWWITTSRPTGSEVTH
jgi:hypothetical protein